jgi:hypothetical protein
MLRTIQESRIFIMDNEVIGAWGKKPHIAFVMLLCTFCFAPYTVVLHDTEI